MEVLAIDAEYESIEDELTRSRIQSMIGEVLEIKDIEEDGTGIAAVVKDYRDQSEILAYEVWLTPKQMKLQ